MKIIGTTYQIIVSEDILIGEESEFAGEKIASEGDELPIGEMLYYQLQKDGEVILRGMHNGKVVFYSVYMNQISKIEKIDTFVKSETIYQKD